MPYISIIVPAYNPGEHFGNCLRSIAAQTFRDYEVIVIDDGSSTPVDPVLVEARNRGKPRVLARRRPVHAPTLIQVAHQGYGIAEVMQHGASRARATFHLAAHVSFLHDVEQ